MQSSIQRRHARRETQQLRQLDNVCHQNNRRCSRRRRPRRCKRGKENSNKKEVKHSNAHYKNMPVDPNLDIPTKPAAEPLDPPTLDPIPLENLVERLCKNGKFKAIITGFISRKKRLPNVIYVIQQYLNKNKIQFCKKCDDGRTNSCLDEEQILPILEKKFGDRYHKPPSRMWYDFLIRDYRYGWLPCNLKSTTTKSADNTGNLAMCVYAYTNHNLDLYKSYHNGSMSKILIEKLKENAYNYNNKKDYFFIVANKTNQTDIIVNSLKGLTSLTPNAHNLPFQVKWNDNREFVYKPIKCVIECALNAIKPKKPSWKEMFLQNVRQLTL